MVLRLFQNCFIATTEALIAQAVRYAIGVKDRPNASVATITS
jgi:hypothetical protein